MTACQQEVLMTVGPPTTTQPIKLQAHADLIQATLAGDLQAITTAIALGADPNAADKQGRAPLAIAAGKGDVDTLNCLLCLSASDAAAAEAAGGACSARALCCAAQEGHEAVVRRLLAWDGSNTQLLRCSVRHAAASGHMRVCAVLLKQLSQVDSTACAAELSQLQQDPTTAQQLDVAILEAMVCDAQDQPRKQAELQQRRQLVQVQKHRNQQLLLRVAYMAQSQPH